MLKRFKGNKGVPNAFGSFAGLAEVLRPFVVRLCILDRLRLYVYASDFVARFSEKPGAVSAAAGEIENLLAFKATRCEFVAL